MIWLSYTDNLYIYQNDWLFIKKCWNYHHQHFLFKIERKQWKWHGSTCNLFWFLLLLTVKPNLAAVLAVKHLLTLALLIFYLYFSIEFKVLYKNIKSKIQKKFKWKFPIVLFWQNIELENQKDFNPVVQKMSNNQVNPLLCC